MLTLLALSISKHRETRERMRKKKREQPWLQEA